MLLSRSDAFGALSQREVEVDGCRVAYTEAGEGPPLLLLHGAVFAGNVFWWETQQALAPHVRTIAPDFPGWGASEKPSGIYTMEYYHRFVEGFIDALGLDQVAIAGHSMGGLVASSFALLHPHRINALATVGVPPVWADIRIPGLFQPFLLPGVGEALLMATPLLGADHPLGIRRFYEPLFHDVSRVSAARLREALVEGCEQVMDSSHRAAFLSSLRANFFMFSAATASEFAARLQNVRYPVVILGGAQDPLFPLKGFEEAHNTYPHARLEILEACGHFPMWECPEVVEHHLRELTLATLESVDPLAS